MADHNELGRLGEEKAVEFLVNKGYVILECNWRYRKLEIDIIALNEGILVVVEVKTRSSSGFGLPQDFITKAKIRHLIQAANQYVKMQSRQEEIRFDILAILKKGNDYSIEHLEDAFYTF